MYLSSDILEEWEVVCMNLRITVLGEQDGRIGENSREVGFGRAVVAALRSSARHLHARGYSTRSR